MNRTLFAAGAAAVMAALLVPLIATADHRPGHEQDGRNPNLSIASEPNPVLWGRPTTISGKLRGTDNTGKTIELEENPYPFSGQFKRVATTTTDAQGDYSFRALPGEHTHYRTVARLMPEPEETSGEESVLVRMRINRRVDDRTPARGQVVTFSGRVAPEHDGNTVLIQRRRPTGTWRTVATTTLENVPGDPNNSMYERGLAIFRDGVFRARIRADEDHLGNRSRRVRLDVP